MFDDIVSNNKTKLLLEGEIKSNEVRHAYIFIGVEGTQKEKMAKEFMKSLLCNSSEIYCNNCSSCRKIDHGNHPDFIEIQPEGNSIKINQIRKMQHMMSIKPYESKYKVFFIYDAQTMGKPAQNSLLKSLEEPNQSVIIILFSNSVQAIIPTILSRCEKIYFQPLEIEVVVNYLITTYNLEETKAKKIAELSQGCIEKAFDIINKPEIEEIQNVLFKYINNIIKGKERYIFELSNWIRKNKSITNTILDYMIIYFRDIMIYKTTFKDNNIINRTLIDNIIDVSSYLTTEQINDIMEGITNIKINMKYNINVQLQIETVLFKIQEEI